MPLRRVGEEAVLRRHPQERRLQERPEGLSLATPDELLQRLRDAGDGFADLLRGLEDTDFRRAPDAETWSAAELAGHASEFPETFARQCLELAGHPGMTVGRQLEDPERVSAVERMEGRTPQEAATMVAGAAARAADLLASLPEEAWAVRGVHARFGEFALEQIVANFIAGHLAGHLEEARKVSGR